jgi:phosphoenolpyruvate synthase/pyruvate phosphate dikinase
MSTERDRLDPASREPLEELLAAIPEGFNAIADIDQVRKVVSRLLVGPELDPRVEREGRVIPGPATSSSGHRCEN